MRIFILGGHKLAYSYYKKILASKAVGDIEFNKCHLIDAAPDCHARQELAHDSQVLIAKSNTQFLIDYLNNPADYHPDDLLVPDHTAKHVLFGLFLELVSQKFPSYQVGFKSIAADLSVPFLHKSEDKSSWAMSFADWTCPADCAEPKICPHTEKTRDWEMASLFEEVKNPSSKAHNWIFECEAFVNEISNIPLKTIIHRVSEFMQVLQTKPLPQTHLVGTHSHCHGIASQFKVN